MERIPIAKRPSARVERLVRTHAGDHPVLFELFDAFLAQRAYQRPLALAIADVARDRTAAWPVRRVATLMLEHCILRIPPEDRAEHQFWFRELGIESMEGDVPRFRARLGRLARIHDPVDGFASTDAAIGDFLHLARRECRLTLGRWIFGSDEVIKRIEHNVRRSQGRRCHPDYGHRWVAREAQHIVETLPPMEKDLVTYLGGDAVLRWVDQGTSTEINALIEYPVGTVVLVIKPPGSDTEIEIKRAGVPEPYPLNVVYARGDWIVPPTHHLHGGAMEDMLAFEASHSSICSKLYRTVWGRDAPMCRTIHMASVFTLPSPAGEADVFDYFTSPRVFGAGYHDMRKRMRQVVKSVARHAKKNLAPFVNELSLTAEFLGQMKPTQAVQVGTTSFRLERLRQYLRPNGDERYFKRGRGKEYTRDDSRHFADEILDEILCVYEPPRVPFRSYKSYLDAAFAVPANRKRAARNYLEIMSQIGQFWGTLLAARGHTAGESFVGRNAGLRAEFEDGEWRIRIIFMDHDSMFFASRHCNTFRPVRTIGLAAKDAKFILGGYFGKTSVLGEVDYLRDIYRATPSLERRGLALLRKALKDAYHRTHLAMRTDPEMHSLFRPAFLAKHSDWDEVVRSYLSAPHRKKSEREAWKATTHAMLVARGYVEEAAAEYVRIAMKNRWFLRKISFLF